MGSWREQLGTWGQRDGELGALPVGGDMRGGGSPRRVFSSDQHRRTAGGVSGLWPSLEALGFISCRILRRV